jgi:hypothetical protein
MAEPNRLRIPSSDVVTEHNAILTRIWSFSHCRICGESFDKATGTVSARDDRHNFLYNIYIRISAVEPKMNL